MRALVVDESSQRICQYGQRVGPTHCGSVPAHGPIYEMLNEVAQGLAASHRVVKHGEWMLHLDFVWPYVYRLVDAPVWCLSLDMFVTSSPDILTGDAWKSNFICKFANRCQRMV